MSYSEFLKRVLTVFLLVVGALAFWRLRQIFMLAFLSVVIAVSLSIPVNRLVNMGARRSLAIATTVVTGLAIIILFLSTLLPAMAVQMANLVEQFPDAFDEARYSYNLWYLRQDNMIKSVLPQIDDEQLERVTSNLGDAISPIVADAGSAIGGIIGTLLVVLVVSVFLLLDPKDYARGFILIIPPKRRERALELLVELRGTMTTWLTALTFSITITTTLVWIALGWFWDVPNALALGVIAGVMTIIPNIGAVVPLVPIAIFTIADEPVKLPFVILTYLAIQLTESNILTPAIVKRQMNIPAALIFLFQLIAASIFGFFGILLAVPLLAVIITLVREIYVYDMLGQRGVDIDIAFTPTQGIELVTTMPEEEKNQRRVMTQTFELFRDMPAPEDVMEIENGDSPPEPEPSEPNET